MARPQWNIRGDIAGWVGMLLALVLTFSGSGMQAQTPPTSEQVMAASPMLQDTLYVLDSLYLEIDIDQQEIYQHRSDGRIDTFLCSTGNDKLPKGIATRTGIFTIKGKAERHVSSRFKVPMYYWMPFDGGIGFHSLAGSDYYIHLGYSQSSHGCVRVSNETGEYLFQTTPIGTIVYVRQGTPARILRFAAETTQDLRVLTRADRGLLRKRLDAVLQGRHHDPVLRMPLAIPRKFGAAIEVGSINLESVLEERR